MATYRGGRDERSDRPSGRPSNEQVASDICRAAVRVANLPPAPQQFDPWVMYVSLVAGLTVARAVNTVMDRLKK